MLALLYFLFYFVFQKVSTTQMNEKNPQIYDKPTQIDSHNHRHALQRGLGKIEKSVEICKPSPELLKKFKCETW